MIAVGQDGTALRYDGRNWTALSTGTDQRFGAVWGSDSSNYWFVGDAGWIVRYPQGQWEVLADNLPANTQFNDVWVSPSDNIYIAGSNGTGGMVRKFDGSNWTYVSAGASYIAAIHGLTDSLIWATGYSYSPTNAASAHKWNGTSWTQSALSGNYPSDVWVSDVNNAWIVGTDLIYKFNGSGWTSVSRPNPSPNTNYNCIWGSSPTNIWVCSSSVVYQWNGSIWSSPQFPGTVEAIWGADQNNMWTVGSSGTISKGDGSKWYSKTNTDIQSAWMKAVWGIDRNNVWAVGKTGAIIKWNGYRWARLQASITDDLKALSGTKNGVIAISSTQAFRMKDMVEPSMVSTTSGWLKKIWGTDATHLWAVGQNGTLLRYENGWFAWPLGEVGKISKLSTVWGSDKNNTWVGGGAGTVFKFDGTKWAQQPTGISQDLNGLWGTSAAKLFAVGAGGTIVSSDGTNWSLLPPVTSQGLYGIHGVTNMTTTTAFAVGAGGTIVKYDGSSWSVVSSGSGETLYGVWVGSDSLAFAVGARGTILRYDGTSWSKMESGTTARLYDVWGSGPSDVWAVGDGGTLLHFDGSKWSWVNSGTSLGLYGVWGTDAKNVWAVGDAGAILKWTTP